MTRKRRLLLTALTLTAAVAAGYALTLLFPTYDDYTYLTYPNHDPAFWKFILPYRDYWRPFDGALGYLVALDVRMYPALNHLLIWAGHLASTALVYAIASQLRFHKAASVATAFLYLLSPAALGATLDVDSANQVYAALFGLCALWLYLHGRRHAVAWWVAFSLLATLSKENGICWLVIAPIIGLSFQFKTRRQARNHLVMAIAVAAAYGALRLSLPNSSPVGSSLYLQGNAKTVLLNVAKYALLTFNSFDFISLFHRPSRNLPLLIATAALSLPLLAYGASRAFALRRDRRAWALAATSALAALPHLLTIFSTMHAYAGLAPATLLMGYMASTDRRGLNKFFVCVGLYLLSSAVVDTRHYLKAYESGMTGKRMAESTIRQTTKPTHRVFCYCIDHGERKYSSFCVIPYDAFGWGNAVIYLTGDQWPQRLDNETISDRKAGDMAEKAKEKLRQGYDHVWIVSGEKVKVIER